MLVETIRKKCTLKESNALEANQPPIQVIKDFTTVTAIPTKNLEIPFWDLQMMETEGNAKISILTDMMTKIKNVTVIFKIFCLERKKKTI